MVWFLKDLLPNASEEYVLLVYFKYLLLFVTFNFNPVQILSGHGVPTGRGQRALFG